MTSARLEHIQVGDTLALLNQVSGSDSKRPRVSHSLLQVTRITEQQIAAMYQGVEMRVRRSDAKVYGEVHSYAIEATPDIIREVRRQITAQQRYDKARARCLVVAEAIERCRLDIKAMEAIADAYAAAIK